MSSNLFCGAVRPAGRAGGTGAGGCALGPCQRPRRYRAGLLTLRLVQIDCRCWRDPAYKQSNLSYLHLAILNYSQPSCGGFGM